LGAASLATSGAALLVLLLYVPSLQAPFLVPKFAALEVAASLGFVALALRIATTGRPRWRRSMAAACVLVLVTTAIAWMTAATRPLGARYALAAMTRWGSVFGLACGVSALDSAPDPREARADLLFAITGAAVGVAALGLLQHAELLPFAIPVISTPGSTFGNRNAAAEVMAVALPVGLGAIAQSQKPAVKVALFVGLAVELVYLAVTRTRGAWLAGACGMAATTWLAKPRWSFTSRALAMGVFVLAGIAATVPGRFNPRDQGDTKRYANIFAVVEDGLDAHSTALKTRLGLWRRTLAMLREHPILGVGPGNWPVEFPRYAEPGATEDGVLSATVAPRQAHNDPLERTAETGIVGLAAVGGLVWACARAIRERLRSAESSSRITAAAAAGALVSILAAGIASFPLEEPGTLVLTGLSLGLIAADQRPKRELMRASTHAGSPSSLEASDVLGPRRVAYAAVFAGTGLLVAAGLSAARDVWSSYWLAKAEHAMGQDHEAATTSVAVSALARCLAAAPNSYRGQIRMAQLKLRQRRWGESAGAARRAIAIEPYSPNGWANLAAAELGDDQPEQAQRDASSALTILHDYPFALDLRARAAEQNGDLESASADREHLRALASGPDSSASRQARVLLQPAK